MNDADQPQQPDASVPPATEAPAPVPDAPGTPAAIADAMTFGTGATLDGKHVPLDELLDIPSKPAPVGAPAPTLQDAIDDVDAGDPDAVADHAATEHFSQPAFGHSDDAGEPDPELLGCELFTAIVDIDGVPVRKQDVIRGAFHRSQMTVSQWNSLVDAERERRMQDELARRRRS